jgi:flagellar hook-length control protein FliK
VRPRNLKCIGGRHAPLLARSFAPGMQPLAISSFTSTNPRAASLSPRDAPSNTPGAQNAPVFARVVGDAVNGGTVWPKSVSDGRPSAPAKIAAAAKERRLDATPWLGKNLLQGAVTPASAVSPASLPALPATSLSLAPLASPAVEQNLSVAPKVNSGVEPPLRSNSDTPGPTVGGTSLTKTDGHESLAQILAVKVAEQIMAQPSLVTTPTIASSLSSGTVVGSKPADSAPASDAATGPFPQTAVDPLGTSAALPTTGSAIVAPPALAATTTPPLTAAPLSGSQTAALTSDSTPAASLVTAGQVIASLLPQVSKPQTVASAPRVRGSTAASTDARLASAQSPQASPPPASSLRPSAVAVLSTTPKGLQSVVDAARTPGAPPNSSPAATDHSVSEDASPDRKGSGPSSAPSALNAAPPTTPAAHDATSILQALEVAASVKQDTAPATNTPVQIQGGGTSEPPGKTASSVATAPPPPATLPSRQGPDEVPNRTVDSARLVEAAGRSEMRIAMDSDKLGPVELRARMVGDQVGAAITVEKRDAHAALAVELPALQQALSDKQLRVEQVTLLHASLGSTAGDAGTARHDHGSGPHAALTPWSIGSGGISQMFAGAEPSGIFDSKGRLSVHA